MITLHHAQGTCLAGGIHEIKFSSFKKLRTYCSSLIELDDKETVYLMVIKHPKKEVYITEDVFHLNRIVKAFEAYFNTYGYLVIQEYKSYEEAYKIALSMNEPSKLCYENNT